MNKQDSLMGDKGGAWSEEVHLALHPENFNFGMASFIAKQISPRDMLEFGSGLGYLSRYIVDNSSVRESYCIEPNKIKGVYRENGYPKLLSIDIFKENEPKEIQKKFDLIISIEVAEHIPRKNHRKLFDFLTSHAENWVVFSGAHIGQGGHGHIAERTEKEWKEEFLRRGMIFQEKMTMEIREACDKKNINHRRNVMVFKKPKYQSVFKKITAKLFG